MNKELCIKVGKWNNSILWYTAKKHKKVILFVFYLRLLLELRVLLYHQTKPTGTTDVNVKGKGTQDRRIIRQDAISRRLKGDYCASRCVIGENKTAAATYWYYQQCLTSVFKLQRYHLKQCLITTLTKNFCTEFKWKENTASSKFVAGCQKLSVSPGAQLSVSSLHWTTHSATALG